MFSGLRPYKEYRETSIPWLQRVPSSWGLERIKSLLAERTEKGHPEEPLLAATQNHGVVWKSVYENRTVTATKDLHFLKLVEVGDFVISLRSFQGGIERCHNRGIISPAYTVLAANSDTYRDYLTHLFKSKPFVDSLTLVVTGIREGQNIDYAKLCVEALPVPPVEDQIAIVRYLTQACARIDKAVATKRRIISVLEEGRNAVIEQAISTAGGLRVPFKSLVHLKEGPGIMAADFRDRGVPLIRLGGMHGPEVDTTGCNYLDEKAVQKRWAQFRLELGDFLLSASGSTGGIKPVGSRAVGSVPYTGLIRLRPATDNVDMRYLSYYVQSRRFADQIAQRKSGVGIEHFGPTHLKRMWVQLPSKDLQRSAIESIERDSVRLNTTAMRIRREVTFLQEFRTRLVADVVTGQIDICDIARSLPEIDPGARWNQLGATEDADAEAEIDEVLEASEV